MNEKILLRQIAAKAKEEFEFFGNKSKPSRERWVIQEFLKSYSLDFDEKELCSPEQKSDVDVQFRDLQFQVKEITDPKLRRGDWHKTRYNVYNNATDLSDIHFVPVGQDVPECTRVIDLVFDECENLSKQYENSKSNLDLIFHITRTRSSVIKKSQIDKYEFEKFGWRSISCLHGRQTVIICASASASDFMKNNLKKINIIC